MTVWISIVLGLAALFFITLLLWRYASRRISLPCPSWLGWLVELDNPLMKEYRASVIVEHLNLQSGMNVLDIGCGPGRISIPAAQGVGPQGEVTALDIQPRMLHRAQEKARKANLGNIRFTLAGIGAGKVELGRYDRALLVTVLGEIPDRSSAMTEIFNALKPGGILSVTEIIFDPHYQRRQTVLRLAEAAGFQEVKFFGGNASFTLHLQKPARSFSPMA